MQPQQTLRIRIDDLPAIETLSKEDAARIFGAGKANRTRLGVEQLEARELLASSVFSRLSSGLLYVEGTSRADNLNVYYYKGQVRVTSNGALIAKYTESQVKSVQVEGLAGNDTINLTELNGPRTINASVWGGSGNDFIRGGAGHDRLDGGLDNDTIFGGLGNDSIYGDAGNDSLFGESGNDRVRGNQGDDILSGGLHYDQIVGDDGSDRLVEYANDSSTGHLTLRDDVLYGLGGDNLSGIEQAHLFGDSRANTLDASGFSGNVTLEGGNGDDVLKAGGGNDDYLYGQSGNDLMYGSPGRDYLFGSSGEDRFGNVDNKDTLYPTTTTGPSVSGEIAVRWNAQGGELGRLGLPTGTDFSQGGGRVQLFRHGAIFTSGHGTFVIGEGPVLQRYLSLGGGQGALGMPVSDGVNFGGGQWGHRFQYGALTSDGSSVARVQFTSTGDPIGLLSQANRYIDARKTAAVNKVLELIKANVQHVNFGNKGWTRIDELTLDQQTGNITCRFTIRAEHSWGRAPEITILGNRIGGQEIEAGGEVGGFFIYNIDNNNFVDFKFDFDINVSPYAGVPGEVLNRVGGWDGHLRFSIDPNTREEIKRVMAGDLSPIWNAAINTMTSDDYGPVRGRYASNATYFASKDFVTWAGAETAARFAATWVGSGGTASGQIAAEIRSVIQAEVDKIWEWLGTRASGYVQGMKESLVTALLQRQNVDTGTFTIRWTTVQYTYGPSQWGINANHLAFAVTWK